MEEQINCAQCEILLSDFLDQTLDLRLQEAVSDHTQGCPSCSALVQQVTFLRKELTDLPTLELPVHLVSKILEATTGQCESRFMWTNMVVQTFRPFLTQRYAFATAMMFVFLSLTVSIGGRAFSAPDASVLTPAAIVQKSDRMSIELYKRWTWVSQASLLLVEQITLIQERLYGHIDYHLVNIVLNTYSESIANQQEQQHSLTQSRRGDH